MNYDLFIPPAVLERAYVPTVSPEGSSGGHETSPTVPGHAVDGKIAGVANPGPDQDANTAAYRENVERAVEALNEVFEQTNVGLRYRVDEATGDTVVSVIDRDSGDTIKQMPPAAVLHMKQRLQELMGVLFDVTA